MKPENRKLFNLLAFVALVIIAVFEIIGILGHFNILNIGGGLLLSLLSTIKNICICVVIGVCAYEFANGRKKGLIVTFWVCIAIVAICTILSWL